LFILGIPVRKYSLVSSFSFPIFNTFYFFDVELLRCPLLRKNACLRDKRTAYNLHSLV
jgi:hypothetical protein